MTFLHDIDHMRAALALAHTGLGRTWPNPSVGCVIVKNNVVIARARTGDGGRPHAERAAIEIARRDAQGATAYVSLEPCPHHGKTPPCTGFLIEAGVKRVVVACQDDNPKVNGTGLRQLQAAGVEVEFGVLEQEARALNQGFFLRIKEHRPLITLKAAVSADGKIAAAPGVRTEITGEAGLRRVHLERSYHDAVLVGINTVLADDPMLNARVQGLEHKTVRVVLDRHLRIPLGCQLVKTAGQYPLWVFHEDDPENKAFDLQARGVEIFKNTDVASVAKSLAAQGITRLLVEGGAQIHQAFLDAGLCDRVCLFKSGSRFEPKGIPLADFSSAGLKLQKTQRFGEDLLEIYEGRD